MLKELSNHRAEKQHNSPQWTRIADYYNEEGTYKDHFLYELSNNLGLLSGLRV